MTSADQARRVLPLIDLTLLGDADTPEEIDALCDAAVTDHGNVAALCVWPLFVPQAVARMQDTSIPVAAVANFPHGANDIDLAVADARQIVADGGLEVDVVFPWRSLADGAAGVGQTLVEATRAAIGADIRLKVILETGELANPDLIHSAAVEALDGGADFLKTSTGKTERSATITAARILLDAIRSKGSSAGIKISGGVKTLSQAVPYLELADEIMGHAWVGPATFRFGASSLLSDVITALDADRDE
jgi:deoxyribose-phosphate aldolase